MTASRSYATSRTFHERASSVGALFENRERTRDHLVSCDRSALQTAVPKLDELRFLFVVGKGGVGKTTVSAALAHRFASQGKRVLVALCHAKDRLSPLLGAKGSLDHETRELIPNVFGVNMTPEASLSEYGRMVLKSEVLYQAIFENRLSRAVLKGTPGLETWTLLGKAYFHAAKDFRADGSPNYDVVILDAPATGHALEMLRVPRVLREAAPRGLLRREAEGAIELLEDQTRTGFVLVTLPEDMPVTETLELARTLKNEFKAPLAKVIVNKRSAMRFTESEQDFVTHKADATQLAWRLAREHVERCLREQECIQNLQQELTSIPLTELPFMSAPDVRQLGEALA